ncbi:uncharacterized protein YcfL/co-chaperonin GroES (HSP10) [Paenibacillus endophyticus]|uniref:Uncharacterized protein YcfL/co-chaperonin GroES (HSP10) n=1 Tax=Paenibacillus endophyticus TaxID=1294268 RepID=A0A7W5CDK3_9BACL|nr:S-layer homology domain-containing protein [Paenibacillus endophyticus]MBB3155720.1 uncharacterized protein YcfL/co-chaperonin GroES (HSP10) [Paenibacillus endophyticus]
MLQRSVTGRKSRKTSLIGMLCFVIIISLFGPMTNPSQVFAASDFSGGSGVIGDPYIITTPDQLNRIRNYSGSHFKLGGNIDLTDYLSATGAGYNGGQYWTPIYSFSGTLDGDGYVVKGLKINRNMNFLGFIGEQVSGSIIKNIGFENVDVVNSSLYFTGAIAGAQRTSSSISNSYVTGKVTGTIYTGGMVGYQDLAEIINSYSTADVTTNNSSNVGGLVGITYKSSITNNYASGAVIGSYPRGGLVGGIYSGENATVFVDNYYDQEVSNDSDHSGKGIPKSTADMKTQSTFSTWDFDSEWFIKDGHYPELQVFLAETPTADIEGGSVAWQTEVELSSGTTGAAIYYTTNGDEPTLNNTLYNSPIVVTDDMTIKAIAVKGTVYNEAMVESYTVTGRPAAPTTGSLVPGTNVDTTHLNGVTDAMEYKVNNSSYVAVATGAASVDNISVQVGDTISVRTAAGSGYPATDAQILTVALADIHPKSTVSTLTSTIGAVSTGGTANEAIKDIPYGTTLAAFKDAITPAADATFEVYEANGISEATSLATGNKVIVTAQDPSSKTTYTITVQEGPPTAYLSQGTNADSTSLNGVTDVMEYKVNNGNYVAIAAGATAVDNITVQDEDTITVRTAATLNNMASVEQVLTVGLEDIKPKSTESTLTSTFGTVSTEGAPNETITSIPYGTALVEFKAAITPAAHATFEVYDANGIDQATTLTTGNKVIVTAQDGVTKTTYTVTVQEGPPEGYLLPGTSFDTTILNGVSDAMEYNVNNGSYVAIATGTTSVDNISVEAGDTISVRTAATLANVASAVQVLTVDLTDIHLKSTIATLTSSIGTVSTGGAANETITNIPYGTTLAVFKAAITPAADATFKVYEANGIDQATTLATGNKVIVTAQDETTKTTYTVTVESSAPVVLTPTPVGPTIPTVPTPTPVVNKPVYNDKVDKAAIAEIKLKAESASSTTFMDVKITSWSYADIDFAARAGIVKGYADGTFRGEGKVTRGEFAKMLVNALGLTATGTQVVTDATGHFAENAIRALLEKGIMTGYADGSFEPNREITRAEIAALLARVLDLALLNTNTKFEDINGSWAKAHINALGNAGIINGKTEHEFIPNANASREESVVLIVRLLKLVPTE